MKVETKYKVDDTFWGMANNKPMELKINQIYIEIDHTGTNIKYWTIYGSFHDGNTFKTKQELINNL